MRQSINKAIESKTLLPFTKYHGLGNDFILVDARELVFNPGLAPLLKDWSQVVKLLAPYLCNRHYGIGADGVILAMPLYGPSDTAVFEQASQGDSSDERTTGEKRWLESEKRGKRLSGEFPSRHSGPSDAQSASFHSGEYREAVSLLTNEYPQVDACQLSWVYTNSDGTNANMCGNGLRCLALWARLRGGVRDNAFKIATAKGAVEVTFTTGGRSISVDVGEPILPAEHIPIDFKAMGKGILAEAEMTANAPHSHAKIKLKLNDGKFDAAAVSMSNPHCVILDEKVWDGWENAQADRSGAHQSSLKEPDQLEGKFKEILERLALTIQKDPAFPESANVEFVRIVSKTVAQCYVYERGCGFTLACASGAAAVVVASVLEKKLERKAIVELPGGPLEIDWSAADNRIRISGPALEVYSGVFKLDCMSEHASDSQSRQAEANCK